MWCSMKRNHATELRKERKLKQTNGPVVYVLCFGTRACRLGDYTTVVNEANDTQLHIYSTILRSIQYTETTTAGQKTGNGSSQAHCCCCCCV